MTDVSDLSLPTIKTGDEYVESEEGVDDDDDEDGGEESEEEGEESAEVLEKQSEFTSPRIFSSISIYFQYI